MTFYGLGIFQPQTRINTIPLIYILCGGYKERSYGIWDFSNNGLVLMFLLFPDYHGILLIIIVEQELRRDGELYSIYKCQDRE